MDHAAQRVMDIRKAADRLASFPLRGTEGDDVLPGIRFLALHMLVRLLGRRATD